MIDESFWRSEPADALRGFGAILSLVRAARSLSALKPESGMYTSPRTSTTAGGSSPRRTSGIARIVRRFGVTSSPCWPSPRVAPRTNAPCS